MSDLIYKLTESELAELAIRGLITEDQCEEILARSRQREPGKFDTAPVRQWLNKPKTIWVQSIHFYGGENFKQPYYFLAEVKHSTTESAWSRFVNQHNLRWLFFGGRIPFTY
jgi:hypothetical protein